LAASELNVGGARVKERDVGLVGLWHALTFGIYNWFWYYAVNRELRDFGEAHGDDELARGSPALSLLAVTLGLLVIVPPFVSWWRCTGRIRRAQRLAGQTELNGWAIGGLYVTGWLIMFAWLAIPVLVQEALNKVWNRYASEGEDPGATAGTPAQSKPKLSDLARED
jgi:hypothetical protein